jgi:hypothetical protein
MNGNLFIAALSRQGGCFSVDFIRAKAGPQNPWQVITQQFSDNTAAVPEASIMTGLRNSMAGQQVSILPGLFQVPGTGQ